MYGIMVFGVMMAAMRMRLVLPRQAVPVHHCLGPSWPREGIRTEIPGGWACFTGVKVSLFILLPWWQVWPPLVGDLVGGHMATMHVGLYGSVGCGS